MLLNSWPLTILLFVFLWFWKIVSCWTTSILLYIVAWSIRPTFIGIFILIFVFIRNLNSMQALHRWHIVHTSCYCGTSTRFSMNSPLIVEMFLILFYIWILLSSILKRKSLLAKLVSFKALWKLLANWRIWCVSAICSLI